MTTNARESRNARLTDVDTISRTSPQARRSSSIIGPSGAEVLSPTKATHVCTECGRAFSRAEHLDRHLTTHMPAAVAKVFVCMACNKGFTRKDVLTRHKRAVHETLKTEVRKSRRKSCRRCASFKIKCTGGSGKGATVVIACKACAKRGAECIFDDPNEEQLLDEQSGDSGQSTPLEAKDVDQEMDVDDYMPEGQRPAKRRKTVSSLGDFGDNVKNKDEHMSGHLLSAALFMSTEENHAKYNSNNIHNTIRSKPVQSRSSLHPYPGDIYKTHVRSHSMSVLPKPRFDDLIDKETHNLLQHSSLTPTTQMQQQTHILPVDPSLTQNTYSFAAQPTSFVTTNANPNFSGVDVMSTIPQEDLHAASTLHGILPGATDHTPNISNGLTNGFLNPNFPTNTIFPFEKTPQVDLDTMNDGYNLPLNNTNTENWFFDQGVFEFDWLRGDFLDFNHSINDLSDYQQPLDLLPPELPVVPQGNAATALATKLEHQAANPVTPPYSENYTRPTIAQDLPADDSEDKSDEDTLRLPPVGTPKGTAVREDPWPWDWQLSSEKQQKINLPPLRKVLQDCTAQSSTSTTTDSPETTHNDRRSPPLTTSTSQNPNVTDKIRQDMLALLNLPFQKRPYNHPEIPLDNLPSNEHFDDFIKDYFRNFHGVLPMIHVPTFRPEKCPSILLSAMATIGARYNSAEGAKDFADSLSELSHRAMRWMGEHNNNYQHSKFYLMAWCLQNVYALGAGNRHLFELADASRSFLINNARRAGLFSSSSSTMAQNVQNMGYGQRSATEDTYLSISDFHDSERLETKWREFITMEGDKRLVWCIFEYDCAISTLSNRRGNIAFKDMCMRIPCEEALWEAPNAQAWAALYPRYKTTPAKGLPFYPVLRDVIAGKTKPTILPNWGKRLCSQVIARIIWDFKEMEDSALNRCLCLPNLTPNLWPAKDALLKALMVIVNSMTERDRMSEMIHMSMTLIISHYSFLYAARDIMDLAMSLARKTSNMNERRDRVKRMRSIFKSDPVNARALAWHATQILTVGRIYQVHTACDTLRVFMGGVYLWAFAKYFPSDNCVVPRSSSTTSTTTTNTAISSHSSKLNNTKNETKFTSDGNSAYDSRPDDVAICLDELPWTKTTNAYDSSAEEWIQEGGKASMHGVADLCSLDGASEVLKIVMSLLQRTKLWGIGDKFCAAVQDITQVN